MVIAALLAARFLFELDGVPVGTVELALDGARYTYTSTHAYRRVKAERVDDFTIGPPRPTPEGYWLWHKPDPGCVAGVAELSNETGQLCAEEGGVREVKGTTFGRPFVARYDTAGELEELQLGKSRFVRTAKALVAGAPYASGFPISGKGKRLALEPDVEGARWPYFTPRGTRSTPVAEADSCLELAQQYAEEHPSHRLALGLVVEKGRAYPHAWSVSDVEGEVDASAKVSKAKQPNRAYLELPRDRAGALYLELLEGKRKLVWR